MRDPRPAMLRRGSRRWSDRIGEELMRNALREIERAYAVPRPFTYLSDEETPMPATAYPQTVEVNLACEMEGGLGFPVRALLTIPAGYRLRGMPPAGPVDLFGVKLDPLPKPQVEIKPCESSPVGDAVKITGDNYQFHTAEPDEPLSATEVLGSGARSQRGTTFDRYVHNPDPKPPQERRIHVAGVGPVLLTDGCELVATMVDGEVCVVVRAARQ